MANSTTTNPMVLDTVGTIVERGIPYTLKYVSYQAAADDNDVELTDALGNTIWKAKVGDVSEDGYNAEAALNYTGNSGLVLAVIDAGTLLLYV